MTNTFQKVILILDIINRYIRNKQYLATVCYLFLDKNLSGKNFGHQIGHVNVPWNIGRNAQNPERFFIGYIENVRIYLKALPQHEIFKIIFHESNN